MPLLSEDAGRRITRRAALAAGALFVPAVMRARAAAAGVLNITAYDGFVPPEVPTVPVRAAPSFASGWPRARRRN